MFNYWKSSFNWYKLGNIFLYSSFNKKVCNFLKKKLNVESLQFVVFFGRLLKRIHTVVMIYCKIILPIYKAELCNNTKQKNNEKIIEWQFCWIKVYKIAKIFEGSSIISYKRNRGQRVNFFVFHRYFCTYALMILYVYHASPRSDRKTKSKLFVVKIWVLIVRIWAWSGTRRRERDSARENNIL